MTAPTVPLNRRQPANMVPQGLNAPSPNWLEWQHDDYRAGLFRWEYVRAHYSGLLLTQPLVRSFLIRKATGETDAAYEERINLADYSPHFATVVDSLAGMLFANEGDKSETWAPEGGVGLGDPQDPTTPIGRLWPDADGAGTSYPTLWKQLATELILTHVHWVLVDSVDGDPRIRLLPPECVPNWVERDGGITDALVQEWVDGRTTLEEEPGVVTRYVRYTLDGWQRYELRSPDGTETSRIVMLEGPENRGTYHYEDRRGESRLPIFRVVLPMKRPVGWMLARKANAIFNQESARDHLLRVANFPKLNLNVNDDESADKLKGEIASGGNILTGEGHAFIAPDVGPATIATEVLKRKIEEFYITGFREYGDAAAQKTATEVRQEVSAGVGAFLQLLKSAVDDAENEALWRVEQTLYPGDAAKWFVAHVERSSDFVPSDVNATIERTRAWLFGTDATLPLGRSAQGQAAKQMAQYNGYATDDAEVDASVDLGNLERASAMIAQLGLPLPAKARALMAVRLLQGLGYVDPSEEIAGALSAAEALSEAESQAGAEDTVKQQQAQFFSAPQGQPLPGSEAEAQQQQAQQQQQGVA